MTTSGNPDSRTILLADKSPTRRKSMWPRRSARVYVLLDVAQGKLAEAVRTLRDRPGVIMVDSVEGPPDIVMVVEAHQRRRLAELTVEALSSIESVTENLQLLPVTADRGCHGHIFRCERTRRSTRKDRMALVNVRLGNCESKKKKTSGV